MATRSGPDDRNLQEQASKAMLTAEGRRTHGAPLVALVEDDPHQSQLFAVMLADGGYRTEVFDSASAFRQRLPAGDFNAVVVDCVLPGESGLELVRWLGESEYSHLPKIMLSRLDADADIVAGLKAGADDYVVKPPRQGELAARVAAHLRRLAPGGPEEAIPDIAPYHVDPRMRRITLRGDPVRLTTRELALALYLFRRTGRVVSRSALLLDVWNLESDENTRTVDTHISRIRRKLELTGAHGWQLNSVYQHGYRLERA